MQQSKNISNTPNFLWLRDISYDEISQVGGKASSLGEMYNNLSDLGIKVPNAFTLTTHLFRQFMKNIQSQIDEIISEIDIDDTTSLKIHASKVCLRKSASLIHSISGHNFKTLSFILSTISINIIDKTITNFINKSE